MRDFTQELDERLQHLIETPVALPVPVSVPSRSDGTPKPPAARPHVTGPPPATRSWPHPRRRHMFLGGVGTAAAVAASTILISGTSAAGLPVLETPTSDASELARSEAFRDTSVDFRAAHVLNAAGARAAVLTTADGKLLCLAIPDPNATAADDLGGCRPTAEVERSGLLVQAQGTVSKERPAPRGAFAFVLPIGATGVHLRIGSSDRIPAIDAGVVLATLQGAATLRYSLRGQRRTVDLPGPFQEGRSTCGDRTADAAPAAGAPRRLASGAGCKVTPADGG